MENFPSQNLENGLDKCFFFPISGHLGGKACGFGMTH